MKHLRLLVVLIIITGIVTWKFGSGIATSIKRWIDFSFCDRPITYRITNIDPKYNLTEEQLKVHIEKAGALWGDIVDKKLFAYDPDGILKINLIYDERQETLKMITNLGSEVEDKKSQINLTSEEYDKRSQQLEKELEDLNKLIDYWNSKGGAPKSVYDSLIDKQNRLKKSINDLNKTANNINSTVNTVNEEIHDLNNKVNYFNNMINIHPEMGLYTSGINTIDIYFYSDENELVHVLAHELGHSLGLGHIEKDDALMNPITSPNTQATDEDKQAITYVCENKNRLDLIKNDMQNLVYSVLSRLYSSGKLSIL